MTAIRDFIETHYRHFNSAALKNAAKDWCSLLDEGGIMFLTMAGAMSTAELGRSLADMIREGKVGAICCTGANLEEDVFNAVAHNHYEKLKSYRDLTPADEKALLDRHLNRVTDTCIPEEEAMRKVEARVVAFWKEATEKGEAYFPHEYLYRLILDPDFQKEFQIPKENSWLLAAAERNLPLIVPGWEDSTLGNMFVANTIHNGIDMGVMKTGLHYMKQLIGWYNEVSPKHKIGFFQIGGGIAGDFPICVVPLIHQDMQQDVPCWSYFCQVTDAQESYGGYSGALPNEKITWGKLEVDTPKYVIHSDATIVMPLIFYYVLGR